LAEGLQNDSMVFHSPTEALLFEYINKQTAQNSFWSFRNYGRVSWAVCGLYIIAILAIYDRWHLRRSSKVVAGLTSSGLALLPSVKAQPQWRPVTAPPELSTTTMPLNKLADWLAHMEWQERVAVSYAAWSVVVAIILLCILAWGLKQAHQRRSFVYIDIITDTRVHMIRCMVLADATRCYKIRVPNDVTTLVVLNFGLFGILKLKSKRWVAKHTLTGAEQRGNAMWLLWPWEAGPLQALLKDLSCRIRPVVVHTHEYSYLKSLGETSTHSPGELSTLV
jgi:hypothetical protein